MKLGFIVPNDKLNLVKGNDFHLCLAHLVDQSEVYREFYKAESMNGAEIVLDNSSFEIGDDVYTPAQLIEFAKAIGATTVMAPETYLNAEETVRKVREFCKGDVDFPVFATIHGSTYEEIKYCYQAVVEIPQVKYVGFSCRLNVSGLSYKGIPNLYDGAEKYLPVEGSSINKGINRAALIAQLTADGIIDESIRHHLLGLNHPLELTFHTKLIHSHDSSAAFIAGYEERSISNVQYEKSSRSIGELEGKELSVLQESLILSNMNGFKELVGQIK